MDGSEFGREAIESMQIALVEYLRKGEWFHGVNYEQRVKIGQGVLRALYGQLDMVCEQHERIVADLQAENARLRQGLVLIARCIRDQANRYARTKLQADDDELQRLIGVFNLPDDRLIEAALQEAIYREGGE